MKLVTKLVVLSVVAALVVSCGTPPTEEMNRANEAVLRAESDADAVAYAGNTLIRARDALSRMQNEADARRYDAAKSFADEAINAAERAIADGRNAAARTRDEALTLVNGLSAPLEETSSTLSAAQRRGDLALDFEALSGNMDSARQSYDNAQQNIAQANYNDAITQGRNTRTLLSDINNTINSATQATRKK